MAKGFSQREFAKEINISASTIGMYESGKRKPSLDKAIMIATYFDTPLERISFSSEPNV